jgi:hypothetical protein
MRSRVEVVSRNPGVDQLFLLVFSLVSNIFGFGGHHDNRMFDLVLP